MKYIKSLNFEKVSEKQILGSLILFYLILRLVNLTIIPMFNDEALWIDWGWKSLNTPNNLWLSLSDAKQPLFIWSLGFSQKIFINPLVAGRIVSVIFGLITTVGIYFIGNLIFNKKTAIISSFTYSVIPIHLFYDRMAMMESAMAAVGVITLYLLILSLDSKKIKYPIFLGIVLGIGLFIKTTAFIFIFMAFLSFLFYIFKFPKTKELNIKNLLISVSVSQLILIPLYSQSMFWENLSTTDRYTLTFSELLKFPLHVWFDNFVESSQMIAWHTTPLVFVIGLIGALLVVRQKKTIQVITSLWLIIGLVFIVFVLRKSLTRYLVPSLPLFSLFFAYFINLVHKKQKIVGVFLLFVSLSIPAIFSYFLITNPSSYFNSLNKLTKFSQRGIYASGWTSGHGINEAKAFLENEAKNTRIVAAVRLDAGNPESAVFAYFNGSKRIIPTYLDAQMFGDQLSGIDCLETSIPLFFISRDIQMAGLHNYFEEVKRFYKPEGDGFVGIHKLKTNCVGNTLKLL